MGARGPKRKSAALEHLDNYPHKGRSKKLLQEASTGYGIPFISKHVLEDAKECVVIIQESMPPGIYKTLDSFLLAAYGMAWALHKRACEEIAQDNFEFISVNDKGNQSVSPWLRILNDQAGLLAKLGDRLGLDPVSRQQVQNRLEGSSSQSKFHGLIGPALIEHNG